MFDLCMDQLEDIVWDEFDQSDDHIVPHPGNVHGIDAFQGDCCKKPRREVIGFSSNAGDCFAAKYVSQGKGEGGLKPLKNARGKMLEKGSWSHTPEGVFPASRDCDSNKEVTSLASDNTRMLSQSLESSNIDTTGTEFCADDPIIGKNYAAVDNNSYSYPLGDISQTDNDLSFFDNDHADNESSDLLYYGWPDIGNFEDVDRMFRSCDSTFGLGVVGNEDELSWLSSSHTIKGSEDVLKSGFKFSCPGSSPPKNIPEQHEPSKLNNASSLVSDSNVDRASISYKSSFQTSEGAEPEVLGRLAFMNGSDAISESEEVTPKEQGFQSNCAVHFNISTVNHCKYENSAMQQAKHHNQSKGKRKDRCLENGGFFHHTGNLPFKDIKLPSGDSSRQVFTSPGVLKQKDIGPDSFGYLQTHIPYMHLDYIHPSDQIPVSSTLSGIKSESNVLTSLSRKESSYSSNQVQSMESSRDCSFEAPAITVDDKREKLQCRQGFHPSYTGNPKHVDLVVHTASCNPILVPKRVHHSKNKVKNHSEVDGVGIRIPTDLDSSNLQESSCVSSGLDEISLEASSFRQLQQVTEQLDIRTKLCIRDSLFRLARSAEQRHHYVNLNGGGIDDRDTRGAFIAEGTNKCNGFMDIETDTNPIDRSVAHLLFHRPTDSSAAHDGLSVKSHNTIHGSSTSEAGKVAEHR